MALPNASSYESYEQDHAYDTDLGYAVMPVAGRTPKYRRIRLHGGIAFRKVSWSTTRHGKPPIIPLPSDVGNDQLLSYSVVPSLPAPNPELNGYNWSVSGEYHYVQGVPRVPGVNSLPTGGFPFVLTPMDETATTLVAPLYTQAQNLAAATPGFNASDYLITAMGVQAAGSNEYVWPFTSLAPIFSNPNSIGE